MCEKIKKILMRQQIARVAGSDEKMQVVVTPAGAVSNLK
jgi:hypothetical protein